VFIVFYLKRLQASFERTLELQSRRYDSQLSSKYLSGQYDIVVIQALKMIISSLFLRQKCLSHFNKNIIINFKKDDDIDISSNFEQTKCFRISWGESDVYHSFNGGVT